MTNPNRAHIILIIDRSGSMAETKTDAEGGIRTFLDAQRELEFSPPRGSGLDISVGLAQFDQEFEWVGKSMWLSEVKTYHLNPRGSTALLDAIGRGVTEAGEYLATIPEDDRPSKVVCVIVTDGYENSSREWSLERVQNLIKQQKDDYAWEFVFLSSDLDAAKMSRGMGITTTTHAPTREGTQAVYARASGQTVSYLSGVTASVEMPDEV